MKSEVIALVLEALRDQFEHRTRVSRQTRAAGNDAESRAENKYDTLSTEENYLADGLAKQAAAAIQAAAEIEKMPRRDFTADDAIDIGALVEIEFADGRESFLLLPAAGGTAVTYRRRTVTVLTPESPLGAQLMDRRTGDRLERPPAKIIAVR